MYLTEQQVREFNENQAKLDAAEAAGRDPARAHYARMGWLLLFGLAHLWLVWHGDILAHYALVGMIAYRFLPLSALPEVDYPTIQVTTLYPGASPDVMTSSVTAPLERQFGQMPGLAQMTSSSSGGASVITLRFSLGLSLDVAEQEVQAAINAGANLLPQDLPVPPIYSKVNPADTPILTLAVVSDTLPLPQVPHN